MTSEIGKLRILGCEADQGFEVMTVEVFQVLHPLLLGEKLVEDPVIVRDRHESRRWGTGGHLGAVGGPGVIDTGFCVLSSHAHGEVRRTRVSFERLNGMQSPQARRRIVLIWGTEVFLKSPGDMAGRFRAFVSSVAKGANSVVLQRRSETVYNWYGMCGMKGRVD